MSIRTRQRGRPCGLTPQKEGLLLAAIRRGLPYKKAAALAGICYQTFLRWKSDGRGDDAKPEFRDFCDRLYQAEAQAADSLLEIISNAAHNRDWKAAAWMLERRFPDEWAKRESAIPEPEPWEIMLGSKL